MSSANILVIAPNFVPDASVGAQRTLSLVNYLCEEGWSVDVVSLEESAFGGLIDQGQLAKLDSRVKVHRFADVDLFNGLRKKKLVHRQKKADAKRKKQDLMPENYAKISSRAVRWFWPLYTPDKKFQWSFSVATNAKVRRLAKQSACIFTSGPPQSVHIAGALLKRLHGIPWVADLRDPWADNHLRSFPNRLARHWDNRLEKIVLGQADHIVANTPYFRNLLQQRYARKAQAISSIPNGYDSALFCTDGGRENADPSRLVITHLGSFYGHRDIRPLLTALKTIKLSHPQAAADFYFEFIGPGTAKFSCLVAEYGLEEQVQLGAPVSYEVAVQKDRAASVLLCLPLTPEDMYSQVPAKIYQFIALGKPVLALGARDGAMAMVLEEAGVDHFLADPRDSQDIAQVLLAIHSRWKQGELRYGGNDEKRIRFDRKNMAARIEKVLLSLAGQAECGAGHAPL